MTRLRSFRYSVFAKILAVVAIFAMCSPTATVFAKDAEASSPPNIIFILNDDQRYDAMGFLDPALKTPNMDRIAREGVHFPNAFVTTALCSPTRGALLAGRNHHSISTGVIIETGHLEEAPQRQLHSKAL